MENYIIEKPILTPYQKLKKVKFKKQTAIDALYYEKYGRQPIAMVRELDKKTSLVWVEDQENVQLFIDGIVLTEFTIEETIVKLEKFK